MTDPAPQPALLHLVRGPGEVYAVSVLLPSEIQAGLDWIRQPGARQASRPFWQAVIEHADEKLARALDVGDVTEDGRPPRINKN